VRRRETAYEKVRYRAPLRHFTKRRSQVRLRFRL